MFILQLSHLAVDVHFIIFNFVPNRGAMTVVRSSRTQVSTNSKLMLRKRIRLIYRDYLVYTLYSQITNTLCQLYIPELLQHMMLTTSCPTPQSCVIECPILNAVSTKKETIPWGHNLFKLPVIDRKHWTIMASVSHKSKHTHVLCLAIKLFMCRFYST